MAIVTLTTDFGEGSRYVAAMKGVLLAINPDLHLVDVSHSIQPQNIRMGAECLAAATQWFPEGTIHVAVVDPGVGTDRRIVYAELGDQRYVLPDNGLLTILASHAQPRKMIAIENRDYWKAEVSQTFHGRDIMAPVAAHLSLGVGPEKLGPAMTDFVRLNIREARSVGQNIEGEVVEVDSFGNLITNITSTMLEGAPTGDQLVVSCDGHQTHGLFTAYGDQPEMTLIALVGSTHRLELAIVNDSAAAMLGVQAGAAVVVSW